MPQGTPNVSTPSSGDYVRQLQQGIHEVEEHFARFYGPMIVRDLRKRIRSLALIEDIRQETLLRVLKAIRTSENTLRNPERFRAYVMGVCNNVRREFTRAESRHVASEQHCMIPDHRPDAEKKIALKQLQGDVRRTLNRIPEKDNAALSMLFLQELPRTEICAQLGVDDAYFRVILHRAKSQFRKQY